MFCSHISAVVCNTTQHIRRLERISCCSVTNWN